MANAEFPKFVGLYCLGIGLDRDDDLSDEEIEDLRSIARVLHRRTGWDVPPNPWKLAYAEGVRLHPLPAGDDVEVVTADHAFYQRTRDRQEQGFWVAHALAGMLILRRDLPHGEVRVWALAAELLVPKTMLDAILVSGHPWAPGWLVSLRQRAGGCCQQAPTG